MKYFFSTNRNVDSFLIIKLIKKNPQYFIVYQHLLSLPLYHDTYRSARFLPIYTLLVKKRHFNHYSRVHS